MLIKNINEKIFQAKKDHVFTFESFEYFESTLRALFKYFTIHKAMELIERDRVSRQKLLSWDGGYQLKYPVKQSSLGLGTDEDEKKDEMRGEVFQSAVGNVSFVL